MAAPAAAGAPAKKGEVICSGFSEGQSLIALSLIQEDEGDEPKVTKTSFTLKLIRFDENKKVPLIKEIKNVVEGMNLVQVRKRKQCQKM